MGNRSTGRLQVRRHAIARSRSPLASWTSFFRKVSGGGTWHRGPRSGGRARRRDYGVEALEARAVLSVSASIIGSGSVDEGSPYTIGLPISFSVAPGVATSVTGWSIDWGNGVTTSLPGNATNAAYTYADGPNSYTIRATVFAAETSFTSGPNGGSMTGVNTTFTATAAVAVRNVAPTFTLSGNPQVVVGETYTLSRSAVVDPGRDTITSWQITWGDGNTTTHAGNATTFSYVYRGVSGPMTITATATDEDGSYSRTTSVNVIMPQVSITPVADGSEDPDEAAPNAGPKPVRYAVSRSHGTANALTVQVGIGSGGMAGSADVSSPPTTVTIPAGQSAVQLSVKPIDDVLLEGHESLEMVILAPPATALLYEAAQGPAAKAKANIIDNDYKIEVVQIAFADNGVIRDGDKNKLRPDETKNGTQFERPQWLDLNGDGDASDGKVTWMPGQPAEYERSYPLNFSRTLGPVQSFIELTANFWVRGALNGQYTITGTATGLLNNPRFTSVAAVGATDATRNNLSLLSITTKSTVALSDKIDFGTLKIDWQIKSQLNKRAVDYKSSQNKTYVPGQPSPSPVYETVLEIGCKAAKGLIPGTELVNRQIADRIQAVFATRAVKRIGDSVTMKYSHRNATAMYGADMLLNYDGHGQCSAWAQLFYYSVANQGVGCTILMVSPGDGFDMFTVRGMPAQGSGANNYLPGTPGYGSNPGFGYHFIVRVNVYPDRLYDPSYGTVVVKSVTDVGDVFEKYETATIVTLRREVDSQWVNQIRFVPELKFTPVGPDFRVINPPTVPWRPGF